jgi:hypothetical protein
MKRMIHEIESSDWPAFCQRISQQRAGAMVKLEVVEPDGVRTERFANATLQDMVFAATDRCSDVITLRLKGPGEIVYEITEPIEITLHSSGGTGDFNPLQINAESGVTFITLHPAIHAEMLAGLKADFPA